MGFSDFSLKTRASGVAMILVACGGSSEPVTTDGPDASTPQQTPDSSVVKEASAPDATADVAVSEGGPAGSCSNMIKDGSETDVDCGGPSCPKCADLQACAADADCKSSTCTTGRCGLRAWSSESTGTNVAIPPNQAWTSAVGLTLAPTLGVAGLAYMRWTGTARFGGGGNGVCHLGQRFVVDGKPTGDVSWGNAIMVMNGSTRWHESFTTEIAMPLTAGAHTVDVQMVNGTGEGLCYLDGDGGQPYDRSRLAVSLHDPNSAWYAESNAETGALPNGPWTDIPGVTVSMTLPAQEHVQASLTGSELAQGSGSAHCAYRFVVDGTPLGDPTHGQAIAVGDVATGWWAPVSLKWGKDLASGAHTIKAQVSTSGAAGGTCNAGQGNNAYARFHLFVNANPAGSPATSVESAGGAYILGTGSQWTTVGGLTANFTTTTTSPLQLELAGTERTISGSGHCAWRFVIDGVPQGEPNHGQAINVGDGSRTWWTETSLLMGQSFAPGSHTVAVDVRNSSSSGDCGTNGDGLPYGRSRLLIFAP